jgi:hypothetical protein
LKAAALLGWSCITRSQAPLGFSGTSQVYVKQNQFTHFIAVPAGNNGVTVALYFIAERARVCVCVFAHVERENWELGQGLFSYIVGGILPCLNTL